jgi:hypothetical protein
VDETDEDPAAGQDVDAAEHYNIAELVHHGLIESDRQEHHLQQMAKVMEHFSDMDEPYQFEPVEFVTLIRYQPRQAGSEVKNKGRLYIVERYQSQTSHPLHISLVSCEELEQNVHAEDDVEEFIEFVGFSLLEDIEGHMVHAVAATEEQNHDDEGVPYLLHQALLGHYDDALQTSLLLAILVTRGLNHRIGFHLRDCLVNIVAHHAFLHFSHFLIRYFL